MITQYTNFNTLYTRWSIKNLDVNIYKTKEGYKILVDCTVWGRDYTQVHLLPQYLQDILRVSYGGLDGNHREYSGEMYTIKTLNELIMDFKPLE